MRYLLLTILAAITVLPTFYYLLYLAFNARDGSLKLVRSKYGGLVLPLVRGWLTTVCAQFVLLFLHLFYRLRRRVEDESKSRDGTVVIMIHGLYHNPSIWKPLSGTLRRAGFGALHTYGYSSFGPTFGRIVQGLIKRVEEILKENPGGKVVFIGHSLGGLLARKAIADPRLKGRVAALVTLGSPHQGSEMARLALGRLGRTLIPDDPIFDDLTGLDEDTDVPKLAICSLVDEMVIPLSRLEVSGPGWSTEITAPLSHVSLAYFPEPQQIVLDFLRRNLGP